MPLLTLNIDDGHGQLQLLVHKHVSLCGGRTTTMHVSTMMIKQMMHFVLTNVIRLTIYLVSLQCCGMLHAVVLCHHFSMC